MVVVMKGEMSSNDTKAFQNKGRLMKSSEKLRFQENSQKNQPEKGGN